MNNADTQPQVRASALVAIVGRPNVGKSTFLNAAIGEKISIVSPVAQTTRARILGVARHGDVQLGLFDTPGIHKPRSRLGRALNASARDAVREADVVVFMTDLPPRPSGALRPHPGDLALLADLGEAEGVPVILAINKVDRVRRKDTLLPLLETLGKVRDFAAVVPLSAKTANGVSRVLDEVSARAERAGPLYEDDAITDRPLRFFAAEFVREKILLFAREEVPHATAVEIETFDEGQGKRTRISATIHVERDGQRKILIGEGGQRLKEVGTAARVEIERLLGKKVHLALWVKVTPGWTESAGRVREFGYGSSGEPS